MPMAGLIQTLIRASLASLAELEASTHTLEAIADRIATCFHQGRTLYLCGNGGSAADAQHVAAEFVGRFLRERRPLSAVALTCNTSVLTAIGNDYEFSRIFARQVEAAVKPGDCVVGISTSGRSANVIEALRSARRLGAGTIGFSGRAGGELAAECDLCFLAPARDTPRIQEAHLVAWHVICQAVEEEMVAAEPSS
jgi:D-sedoheptulose 7-phosphate isomerase